MNSNFTEVKQTKTVQTHNGRIHAKKQDKPQWQETHEETRQSHSGRKRRNKRKSKVVGNT